MNVSQRIEAAKKLSEAINSNLQEVKDKIRELEEFCGGIAIETDGYENYIKNQLQKRGIEVESFQVRNCDLCNFFYVPGQDGDHKTVLDWGECPNCRLMGLQYGMVMIRDALREGDVELAHTLTELEGDFPDSWCDVNVSVPDMNQEQWEHFKSMAEFSLDGDDQQRKDFVSLWFPECLQSAESIWKEVNDREDEPYTTATSVRKSIEERAKKLSNSQA